MTTAVLQRSYEIIRLGLDESEDITFPTLLIHMDQGYFNNFETGQTIKISNRSKLCDNLIRITYYSRKEKQAITELFNQIIAYETSSHTSKKGVYALTCASDAVLQALDAILVVSKEFFATKDQWYKEAAKFMNVPLV